MASTRQVLECSRRVLLQKEALLAGMEKLGLEEVYGRCCGTVGASIGAHVRHSLDHYDRVVDSVLKARGKEIAKIKYDTRARGTKVETELSAGFEAIMECSLKLGEIDPDWLEKPVQVEFNLDGANLYREFDSNGLRELWFVAHHSIHHQAMIKIIAESCPEAEELKKAIPKSFGLAPSTIHFHEASHSSSS